MHAAKYFTVLLAAGLSAGGWGVWRAQAAENTAPENRSRTEIVERIKERLALTDEQIEQIRGVLSEQKETLTGLLTKLHEVRAALRQAVQAEDSSEAAIRGAAAKVAGVEADLAVERHKFYKKVKPILTAEQREKVKEFQDRIDDFLDNALLRLGGRAGRAAAQ